MLNIPVRRRSPEPTVPPSEPVSGTLHFLQVRIAPLLTGCSSLMSGYSMGLCQEPLDRLHYRTRLGA